MGIVAQCSGLDTWREACTIGNNRLSFLYRDYWTFGSAGLGTSSYGIIITHLPAQSASLASSLLSLNPGAVVVVVVVAWTTRLERTLAAATAM